MSEKAHVCIKRALEYSSDLDIHYDEVSMFLSLLDAVSQKLEKEKVVILKHNDCNDFELDYGVYIKLVNNLEFWELMPNKFFNVLKEIQQFAVHSNTRNDNYIRVDFF